MGEGVVIEALTQTNPLTGGPFSGIGEVTPGVGEGGRPLHVGMNVSSSLLGLMRREMKKWAQGGAASPGLKSRTIHFAS